MLYDFTYSSDLPEPSFALSGKSSVFSPSPCCHGFLAASGSFHLVIGIQGAAHTYQSLESQDLGFVLYEERVF